jgi:hypothetical protein
MFVGPNGLQSQAREVQNGPLSQAPEKRPGGSFLAVQAREADLRHLGPSLPLLPSMRDDGKQRKSKERVGRLAAATPSSMPRPCPLAATMSPKMICSTKLRGFNEDTATPLVFPKGKASSFAHKGCTQRRCAASERGDASARGCGRHGHGRGEEKRRRPRVAQRRQRVRRRVTPAAARGEEVAAATSRGEEVRAQGLPTVTLPVTLERDELGEERHHVHRNLLQ